jgi:hypothetical protein
MEGAHSCPRRHQANDNLPEQARGLASRLQSKGQARQRGNSSHQPDVNDDRRSTTDIPWVSGFINTRERPEAILSRLRIRRS